MRESECREVILRIAAYLEDNVGSEEQRMIQAHLRECSHCQRELHTLERVPSVLKRWEPELPSRAMWVFISQRIEAQVMLRQKRTQQRQGRRWWVWGGLATAGAAAALAWFLFFGRPTETVPIDPNLVLNPDGYLNSHLHLTSFETPTEYSRLTGF